MTDQEENISVTKLEQSEGSDIVTEAFRPATQDALERLLSNELALATFSADPLEKIRHILEAYQLLDEDQRKKVECNKEKRSQLIKLHNCTISLNRITELSPPPDTYGSRHGFIPWSFANGKASSYLFWITRYFTLKDMSEKTIEYLKNGDKETWNRHYKWLAKYTRGYAMLADLLSIRTEYIEYTMPLCIALLRKIHEEFITPETWKETIGLFSGRRGKRSEGGAASTPF